MQVASQRVDRDVHDRHVELDGDGADEHDPRELEQSRVEAI